MSARARLAVALAIALLSAAGIAVLAVHWLAGAPRAAAPRGLTETPAVAPFGGYREVRIDLVGRCRRVVIADTRTRRKRGLRGVADLGPYAGMLFVESNDSDTPFTMAGLTAPLEIAWYAADGRSIGATRMRPCPVGDAEHCPVIANRRPYRFALETPAGSAPPGLLAACH